MYDKIKEGYYQNETIMPRIRKAKCPKCIEAIKPQIKFCSNCGNNLKGVFESHRAKFNRANGIYHTENSRLHELFKKELLEEFLLDDHANADNIFDYAWAQGHAAGHHEVYTVMEELAPLFKRSGRKRRVQRFKAELATGRRDPNNPETLRSDSNGEYVKYEDIKDLL